jgi:hypothetical protein
MLGNDNYKHRPLGLQNKNIVIIIAIIELHTDIFVFQNIHNEQSAQNMEYVTK